MSNEKTIVGEYINLSLAVDSEGTLRIHFDGTTGVWQWLYNFCFWPFLFRAPYRDMPEAYLVCWGFFKGYKEVQDPIYRYINENLATIKRAEITGYSRGGACAMFCAEDILYKYALPVYCEVMGAPKILDKKGLEVYKKRKVVVMGWKYGADIVTELPPGYYTPARIVPSLGGVVSRPWWDVVGKIKDHSGYFIEPITDEDVRGTK